METSTIGERMTQLIDKLNLNNNSFAVSIDTFGSVIGNLTGGRQGKPSFDLLERMARVYPTLNIDWLVRGEGEMFKRPESTVPEPESDCWELIEREQERARQLQADYDKLLTKYLEKKRG